MQNVKEHDADNYGGLQDVGDVIELTEEDIDVVQQLAIWHFTNTGDAFDVGETQTFELYLNSKKDDLLSEFRPLSDADGEGTQNGEERAIQAVQLYQYFVNHEEANAATYDYKKAANAPYEIASTSQTSRVENNNYIIGPFKINEISDTEATLEGKFVNGEGETLNPILQNEDGEEFESLKDTVGQNFYIVLPTTTNIDEITFSISGYYFNTKLEYWSVADPENEQPVVIVEKTKEEFSDEIKYQELNFDLALRKFIVSINGVAPEVDREPDISDETLEDALLKYRRKIFGEEGLTPEDLVGETSEEVETETKSTTGTITELYQATQNGTTQFFFVLEGDENLYISSISNNSRQVQMSVGSKVSIEYYMSPNEELVGIVSKIEIQ